MNLLRPDLRGYTGASNLAFNEKIKKLKSEGEDIIHFGFGQSPFPVPGCMVDRLKEFAHVNDYLSVAGDLGLRNEICAFHAEYDGLTLTPENIIVAPGSKSLIYLALAVYGGTVWLAAPAWTTYDPQARLAGHQPRILNTKQENGWKLRPEDVMEGMSGVDGPNLLIFNNPGNPSGTVYSKQELVQLVKVFRELNIILLSDEIYARLSFEDDYTSVAQLYPENTILTTGFSKWVGAGGWRLGYAHFPANLSQLKQAVLSGASHTHSCAAAPVQFAVAKSLKEDKQELRDYASRASLILSWVADFCYTELSAVGVQAQRSEAGYYFMPDFQCIRAELAEKGIKTGQQMCNYFLEECQVALMPSSYFLLGEDDLSVRFCFVEFDGGKCLKELQLAQKGSGAKLNGRQFVEVNCPQIVKGVKRIVDLVNKLKNIN